VIQFKRKGGKEKVKKKITPSCLAASKNETALKYLNIAMETLL